MNPLFSQGHACIIGVGADLPNTVNDAIGLADILKDPGRCAYPPEQVQVLTEQQATREAVLAALERLAGMTTPEATVMVYFSGHGYKVSHPMMGDRYFLMPYGYDLKALPATTIAGDEFVAKLRAIPAKKLLLLLDCCHAGGLGDLSDQGVTLEKAPLPPEAQALFEKGKGRIVIASSAAHEKSFAGKPYSAFTLAVIEALAGQGASVKDGYVRVADLAMYTGKVVPNRTQERQNPMLNFEGADNFFLAYYAGGEKEPKGLPYAGEPEVVWEAAPPIATQVQVSGQHNVVNLGNVSGSIVTSNVTQQGTYNFNAQSVSGLQIGDTYVSSEERDEKGKASSKDQSISHKQNPVSGQKQNSLPEESDQKEVFISYAWGGKSEEIANQIEQSLKAQDILLIRDKNNLGFKGRIKAFMERIGQGKCVVLVISEKYLKSENCMFELLQIAKNEQFYERIFPVVLEDAKIYKPKDRIQYVQYWEQEIQELDHQIRSVSSANLEGFREDIDLYNEIRQYLPRLTNILKDMNTLTVQIHTESGFAELIQAIEQKLEE